MSRVEEKQTFLDKIGWGKADVSLLAGDASFRRYDRVKKNGTVAVLMDAPPEFEDTRPFYNMAKYLKENGLSAPEIYAHDFEKGFLLLEDLGDNLYKNALEINPEKESVLYKKAVDELIKLNKCPALDVLPSYDMSVLLTEVSLITDWYYPALKGKRLSDDKRNEFLLLWQKALSKVSVKRECVVLRDYHAENLLDMDNGKVGQLDFQDALIGHSAYDLVSLLQDARRDVSLKTEQEMTAYFIEKMSKDSDQFKEDYAVLGAQRNSKIIGIFARLYLRDGKDNYLKLMPRMWGLLERCLEHPALKEIKNWFDQELSEKREQELNPLPLFPNKAMILAAGLGTRMRPLTDTKPKPLIEISGKPMLAHSLDSLVLSGIKKVIINKHYFPEHIEKFVKERKDWRPEITLSDETDCLLDSGGGVKKALPEFGGEAFYVLNSDMVWTEGVNPIINRLASNWDDDKMDILMMLVKREKAFGHDGAGDFHMNDKGQLTWRGDAESSDYLYGGILIIKPGCFDGSPDGAFSLRTLFDQAEKEGRLYGIIHDGEWYHVGTPEAVTQTEQLIKGN